MSAADSHFDWVNASAFIETQFPVAQVSAESYKERDAKQSQTLTGLGKWWGRKPLVLVRATVLGLLLPSTNNPEADRDVFLKLMTMDNKGLKKRRIKALPYKELLEAQPQEVQELFLENDRLRNDLNAEELEELDNLTWNTFTYTKKLEYCSRPEHTSNVNLNDWNFINSHLETTAKDLTELVHQLGLKRFGHTPRVGDSFCGGGSIPFESARIGCNVYASDLNPVAGLLTWGALNIVGGSEKSLQTFKAARQTIYDIADAQITTWGIEHNELGWRADAYLYCVEAIDPESGWRVPLAPSWVIGEKTKTIAHLEPDAPNKRYDIKIMSKASSAQMSKAKIGTVLKGAVVPPDGSQSTPIKVLRRDIQGGLRPWENNDLVPRSNDVFQERLYCIRWVETYYIEKDGKHELSKQKAEALSDFAELLDKGKLLRRTRRHYRAPDGADVAREQHVLELMQERFIDWQVKGFIPSRRIETGYNTEQPIRERGWTHWHHLFTPRQLLTIGLLSSLIGKDEIATETQKALLLLIGRCSDFNARLSRWHSNAANERVEQVFSNQALNTLYNFGSRTLLSLNTTWFGDFISNEVAGAPQVQLTDARAINHHCDYWITDPPYADAVNYEEISEFFSSWYDKHLERLFPNWYSDSKRALAVKGNDSGFRNSMVECYSRLAAQMPDNGAQVVMFTHQDAAVWADLSLILWAAGLRVTAAWCIATETDSALKSGNYVQGTVLLILRKRTQTEGAFLDEIIPRVETEVRKQLDSMTQLEDHSNPNFSDADYQLAAYAAALRVLTAQPIEEINPQQELRRERTKNEKSPVVQLIENAVRIACDHLVPQGLSKEAWKKLSGMERFYLKGLEVETHGETRVGAFQELARGFGATEYTTLYANNQANQARLQTASEFGSKQLNDRIDNDDFASSLLRHALFAIYSAVKAEDAKEGLNYLKTELPAYWAEREQLMLELEYLARLEKLPALTHWVDDAGMARVLLGAIRNDSV